MPDWQKIGYAYRSPLELVHRLFEETANDSATLNKHEAASDDPGYIKKEFSYPILFVTQPCVRTRGKQLKCNCLKMPGMTLERLLNGKLASHKKPSRWHLFICGNSRQDAKVAQEF